MSFVKKSPWLFHLNTGGCNGCDIEIVSCIAPGFDIERFGCRLVGSPRHADIILVTGPVNRHSLERIKRVVHQSPKERVVIGLGSCTISGGMFKESYNTDPPLDKHLPVTLYIPGCPPKPEAIIAGLKKALEALK